MKKIFNYSLIIFIVLTSLTLVTISNSNELAIEEVFYENTILSKELNKIDILVNKNIYLPENYIPNNLEEIDSRFTNSSKLLVKEAKDAFEKMAKDALKKGYHLRVISAYRSYNYQANLYNQYVIKDGEERADTYSARPGHSEHQTGLAIDIDNSILDYNYFEKTKEFTWMQDNAYKYGFILRYPKDKEKITGYSYEAWHYRYVGKNLAKYLYKHNKTLEEYKNKKR